MNRHSKLTRCCSFAAGFVMFLSFAILMNGDSSSLAAPACNNGGVLLVFARGSGVSPGSWQGEAFRTSVSGALGTMPVGFVEIGNQDGVGGIDPGGYPAWAFPALGFNNENYIESHRIGVHELLALLNQRASTCPRETFVLGGFSQGAHVVGTALFLVPQSVKERIGWVALYGDPQFHGNSEGLCQGDPWERLDIGCLPTRGVARYFFGARTPYLPSDLIGRVASWCDPRDDVCRGNPLTQPWGSGSHNFAYSDAGGIGWIRESAREIAYFAVQKRNELNPEPPRSELIPYLPQGPYSSAVARQGSLLRAVDGSVYVFAGQRLFRFDPDNTSMLSAFREQSLRLTGTDEYIPMDTRLAHTLEVNRNSSGTYAPGANMSSDNTWLYEYGSLTQYIIKYQHPLIVGSPQEVIALGGQDRAIMVPAGSVGVSNGLSA